MILLKTYNYVQSFGKSSSKIFQSISRKALETNKWLSIIVLERIIGGVKQPQK
jgi:hypothetical protein